MWNKPSVWFSFWTRRYFRIAPLYYCCLIIFYAFLPKFVESLNVAQGTTTTSPLAGVGDNLTSTWFSSPSHVLLHLTFLFGLFPKFCGSTAIPDWSLSLEMQFYALFPFFMLASRKKGWLPLIVISILALLITKKLFVLYDINHPGLLGVFPRPSLLSFKGVLFLAGMLLGVGFLALRDNQNQGWLYFLTSLVLCSLFADRLLVIIDLLFILCLATNETTSPMIERLKGLLESSFAKFFGELSYPIYLIHVLVLSQVNVFFAKREFFGLDQPIARAGLVLLIAAPVTFLLAWASNRYVEKPGIQLGRKIVTLFRARTSKNNLISG